MADTISTLPDSILSHILSFLNTKHCGVEDLNLHVGNIGWPILPINIFRFKTLVSLKLHFFHVEYNFELVELPLLKTLNLQFITFVEDLDFMLLLDGCPMLEYLFIEDLFYEFEDEEFLRFNKWKNFSLSKLRRAHVDQSFCHFPLKSLQNVRTMWFEIDQEFCCKDIIPTFHNLIDLDLVCLNYHWHILLEVLKHCPKLQSLSINQTGMNMDEFSPTRKDDKESWVKPDFVPQCLSLHLRTCHVFSFLGLQSELLLAKYILKNARVLQTMKIFIIGQPKIRRLLCSSPRDSSTCKLTFRRDPSEYC